MRADVPAVPSKSEAALSVAWQRYAGIAVAALLSGAILWPLWKSADEGAGAVGLAPACASWDDLARESIARLVQNGTRDADLRQANDAIFRLRRARRNCDAGWTTLACQDYLAVAHGAPGLAASRPPHQPGCTATKADEADGVR